MNSSGLIYAVIVGAWAAYLVPMWLRRQDELNESRPTERFSTAIRLLSGKAAMERRYARENERRDGEAPEEQSDSPAPDGSRIPAHDDEFGDVSDNARAYDGVSAADVSADLSVDDSVDVRAYADPRTIVGEGASGTSAEGAGASGHAERTGDGADSVRDESAQQAADREGAERAGKAEREKARLKNKRAKVLARRRRTTMVLFLAFTAGTVVAAVGGLGFLWAPAAPGLLLSTYIVHLRVQERRRFAAVMDKRRAEAAGHEPHGAGRAEQDGDTDDVTGDAETVAFTGPPTGRAAGGRTGGGRPPGGRAPAPEPGTAGSRTEPTAAGRRALVEQTDHAEWVDQQRDGAREPTEGWDPVPVPLPTYVSAPVAPRSTRGVDLEAPGTWSSARSSSASGEPAAPSTGGTDQDEEPSGGSRRGRGRRQTPLFDQYEGEDRPRAANE